VKPLAVADIQAAEVSGATNANSRARRRRIGGTAMIIDDRSEWLETDGLGGFASGTVSGIRTRRYHALLLTAVTPPTGRVVLVNGLEAWVETAAGSFAITAQRYAPDVIHPDGATRIASFTNEPWPTWEFELPGDVRIRQELFVGHGPGAAELSWTVVSASAPIRLNVRPLLSGRDHHATHHENGAFRFAPDVADASVAFQPYDGLPAIVVLSNGRYEHAPEWYRNFLYREESERGLDATEDLASPGVFRWQLDRGARAVWILKPAATGKRESRSRTDVELLYEHDRTAETERRQGLPTPIDRAVDAGVPGVQLTWMDARVGDRVITPRIGKPVEIQALWLNALAIASSLESRWRDAYERGRMAFAARFFDEQSGSLADVIDVDHVPGTRDDSCRPNQILAVGGLPIGLLDRGRARRVVDLVERRLVTPLGLRSLAPGEPGYAAHYAGDSSARDAVYHQGTVWPWLIGPFVEAWVRVRGNTSAAKQAARTRFLEPLAAHLATAGLGHISEIADGDSPFTPRGCPFQAWSLGEFVRVDRAVLAGRERAARRRGEPQWA
jgi:glycogen debranching enzyme